MACEFGKLCQCRIGWLRKTHSSAKAPREGFRVCGFSGVRRSIEAILWLMIYLGSPEVVTQHNRSDRSHMIESSCGSTLSWIALLPLGEPRVYEAIGRFVLGEFDESLYRELL